MECKALVGDGNNINPKRHIAASNDVSVSSKSSAAPFKNFYFIHALYHPRFAKSGTWYQIRQWPIYNIDQSATFENMDSGPNRYNIDARSDALFVLVLPKKRRYTEISVHGKYGSLVPSAGKSPKN